MAYDIHGNDLRPGHCEVHPWVHQEYPCSICEMEIIRNNEERVKQERPVKTTVGDFLLEDGTLNHLKNYYLILQVMANASAMFAAKSDSERASLRNLISEIEHKPCQEVQEENETEAYQQFKNTGKEGGNYYTLTETMLNTIVNILSHGR
jgi:hypothetical protein